MRQLLPALALVFVVSSLPAAAEEQGFAEIRALGQLNGVALECGFPDQVRRMKRAVITFVPKTRTHGAAFEEATNAGFLEQIEVADPCPTAATLEAAVDKAIEAVRRAYPPSSP